VSLQIELLPAAQLKVERRLLHPDQLIGHENSHPRTDLIGLVRDLGLLQLPFAASINGEVFTLVEGRRRTKAVLILIETGQWPGKPLVECVTYVGPEAARPGKMAAIALALHATRAESIATELRLRRSSTATRRSPRMSCSRRSPSRPRCSTPRSRDAFACAT
jgi:hypothetical protein